MSDSEIFYGHFSGKDRKFSGALDDSGIKFQGELEKNIPSAYSATTVKFDKFPPPIGEYTITGFIGKDQISFKVDDYPHASISGELDDEITTHTAVKGTIIFG